MTDEELFDRRIAIEGIGPRRDLTKLPMEAGWGYGRLLDKVKGSIASAVSVMPKLGAIYAAYIEGTGVNAFAFRYSGRYFVGINDGVPLLTMAIARRMLADPLTFPNVGDPTKESSADLPLLAGLEPDARSVLGFVPKLRMPVDDRRTAYASHVAEILFDFIAAHEMTHVAHGHTDYYEDEYGLPLVRELGYIPGSPSGNLDFQAMELDADFFAAHMMTINIKRIVEVREQLPPVIRHFYRDPQSAMFDLAVAVCLLARIFEDDKISGVDLTKRTHPPWRWRQMMVLNAIANYALLHWDAATAKQIEAATADAVRQVEFAFQTITGTGERVDGLNDVWGPPGFSYAKTLMEHWQTTLRGKLLKYAKKELPIYNLEWEPSPAAS